MSEMTAEETNKKEDKTKSESSGPMGSGMFEMMKKCCEGEGAFLGCAAVMKSMMGAMTNMPCSGPGTGKTGPERREK
jgi:hypothetical protein